jgi:hypothetical protein
MKEPAATPRSPLGYLAAFTLGIICMGAIMFFTSRNGREPSERANNKTAESERGERSRSHFQRIVGSSEALVPPATRGILKHPTDLKPPLVGAENSQPAAQEAEIIVRAPPFGETIVRKPATVVAGQAVLGADVQRNTPQLSGRVFLQGQRPVEKVLPLDRQCAAKQPGPVTTRFYVTGQDNSLADVLVMVSAGLPSKKWPVPRNPVTLRLRGCIYENHVVGVQVGQLLQVANLDDIMHNIHNTPQRNPEQNRAILPRARELDYKFKQPELFLRFKCDVHPWEFAYVNVIEHPFFAISDGNGNFGIDGLVPGNYTLQAHHRKAGMLQKKITVENARNIEVNFEFKAPATPLEI